jgi:hypothetical protein
MGEQPDTSCYSRLLIARLLHTRSDNGSLRISLVPCFRTS